MRSVAFRGGGARPPGAKLVALLGHGEGLEETSAPTVERVSRHGPREAFSGLGALLDVFEVGARRHTRRHGLPRRARAHAERDRAEGVAPFTTYASTERTGHGAVACGVGARHVSGVRGSARDAVSASLSRGPSGQCVADREALLDARVLRVGTGARVGHLRAVGEAVGPAGRAVDRRGWDVLAVVGRDAAVGHLPPAVRITRIGGGVPCVGARGGHEGRSEHEAHARADTRRRKAKKSHETLPSYGSGRPRATTLRAGPHDSSVSMGGLEARRWSTERRVATRRGKFLGPPLADSAARHGTPPRRKNPVAPPKGIRVKNGKPWKTPSSPRGAWKSGAAH